MSHSCGDPDCDGEALAMLMKACEHVRRQTVRTEFGYGMYLDEVFSASRLSWCRDCGAIGVPKDDHERDGELEWRQPNWRAFGDFRG